MHPLPETFAHHMAQVFGAAGEAWLAELPGLIGACERRWGLTVAAPFDLSYNFVAPAVRAEGSEVVLKLGVPHPELLSEMAALRCYDGRGIARLLDADEAWGAMVLERLWPGVPLISVEDDEAATRIAAGVMRQLWQPAPANHTFPTVEQWAEGLGRLRARFNGGTGPLPSRLVEQAEALFAELLPSQRERVLLHGDLHHWNILSAARQPWLAIDPKGIVGEAAYEVGAVLRNPWGRAPSRAQLARRVDIFAEMLGFDRARLIGWGVAQAVLSAWWSIEDTDSGGDHAIACAEALAGLK